MLIDNLSFTLPPAAIVGVIGPNGAGKTTLMRMITGQEQADSGSFKVGETVKLAYVDQSRDSLDPDKTVWEEISGGVDWMKLGDRDLNTRAYVNGFNFKGTDQQKKVGVLSGGERNRLHLAKLIASGGNFLILDEPTNDLDTDTLRALEEALLAFAGCAIVVSHDRWFLDRIATHVLAFEGDSQVRWFEGNFEAYEAFRHEQLVPRGRSAEADLLQEARPRLAAQSVIICQVSDGYIRLTCLRAGGAIGLLCPKGHMSRQPPPDGAASLDLRRGRVRCRI
jgi:sulfate-transporting ATPase